MIPATPCLPAHSGFHSSGHIKVQMASGPPVSHAHSRERKGQNSLPVHLPVPYRTSESLSVHLSPHSSILVSQPHHTTGTHGMSLVGPDEVEICWFVGGQVSYWQGICRKRNTIYLLLTGLSASCVHIHCRALPVRLTCFHLESESQWKPQVQAVRCGTYPEWQVGHHRWFVL